MLCITSEFPFLMLVMARKLVTTTQLYGNELFPSATFIHWCQNLAFMICPYGRCVCSLVPAPSQNELGCRLIGKEFFICKRRSKTGALFHASRPIGVSSVTQNDKSGHNTCHYDCDLWRHLVWIALELKRFSGLCGFLLGKGQLC